MREEAEWNLSVARLAFRVVLLCALATRTSPTATPHPMVRLSVSPASLQVSMSFMVDRIAWGLPLLSSLVGVLHPGGQQGAKAMEPLSKHKVSDSEPLIEHRSNGDGQGSDGERLHGRSRSTPEGAHHTGSRTTGSSSIDGEGGRSSHAAHSPLPEEVLGGSRRRPYQSPAGGIWRRREWGSGSGQRSGRSQLAVLLGGPLPLPAITPPPRPSPVYSLPSLCGAAPPRRCSCPHG